jgi:peptidyl-prolyl cis-trans isomerase SDCCAG10
MRMSEVEVDDAERPIEPIVIKNIEILWNPFDDIIPR